MSEGSIHVLKEYPKGSKVAVWFRGDAGTTIVIPPLEEEPPDGDYFRVPDRNARYRASLVAELCEKRPKMPLISDEDVVPTKIALGPRPQLTAYLYAVRGWSIPEIALNLNVDQSSVKVYLSRFKQD